MSVRPPPGTRRDYRAFRSIPTRWMDNDVFGHVNNVVYYSFFDTAVNQHLIEAGVLDIAGSRFVGLVVETQCRFARSIAFPDVITSGLRVARIGTSSVRYEIGLFRNDDDAAAAEGHFVHAYVDRDTCRSAPIPPDVRRVLVDLQP